MSTMWGGFDEESFAVVVSTVSYVFMCTIAAIESEEISIESEEISRPVPMGKPTNGGADRADLGASSAPVLPVLL